MLKVFAIGNSHANFFTDSEPGSMWWANGSNDDDDECGVRFYSCNIGPVIAYNFHKKHLPYVLTALQDAGCPKGPNDVVMMVVGEVDCRLHIPKRCHEHGLALEETVDICARRYFKAILALRNIGYNVACWAGHPTSVEGAGEDAYPFYGDWKYRNGIVKAWAKQLESLCLKYSVTYVSILDDLMDADLRPKDNIFTDPIHLRYDRKLIKMVSEKMTG